MALIVLEEFTRTKKQKNKKTKRKKIQPQLSSNRGAKGKSPRLQELSLIKDWHIHLDANPRADVSGNTVLGQRLTSKASSS